MATKEPAAPEQTATVPAPPPFVVQIAPPTDPKAQKVIDAENAKPALMKIAASKGDPVVAIHQIHHAAEDGSIEVVEPGTTFRPNARDITFLTKQEAIRETNDTEKVMFERLETTQAAATTDAEDALG